MARILLLDREWRGDRLHQNYHAEYADQRWAYDLITDPHSLGSSANEDYGCFGQPVPAPVSGEVRTASDGEPDRTPDDNAPDIQNAFGNYVVIRPDGTDHRLIIAHLMQGSIVVKRGQQLREGERIAQCGNSGNSTEPHVHIHYVALHEVDGDIVMTGLPLFFRDHGGAPMPAGGYERRGGKAVAVGATIAHGRASARLE